MMCIIKLDDVQAWKNERNCPVLQHSLTRHHMDFGWKKAGLSAKLISVVPRYTQFLCGQRQD